MGVALPYIMSGEPSCACVVLPMGEVVPAKLTYVSTCAHQSGYGTRV